MKRLLTSLGLHLVRMVTMQIALSSQASDLHMPGRMRRSYRKTNAGSSSATQVALQVLLRSVQSPWPLIGESLRIHT